MSNLAELRAIRKRLRRGLTERGTGGFEYDAVFPKGAGRFNLHVQVRVMLRGSIHDARYRFKIQVDSNLKMGASGDEAADYAQWMSKAARKAKWAEGIVGDCSWAPEQLHEENDDE